MPRRNLAASYKVEKVRLGIEKLFTKYKDKLMEDVDLPLKVQGMTIGSELEEDDNSTEADSTLLSDLKEAHEAYAELEANEPLAELDASKPLVELPAESKVSEVVDRASTRKRYELEA